MNEGPVAGECSASLSGRCLAESQGETACDTEAGECAHGGVPVCFAHVVDYDAQTGAPECVENCPGCKERA